MPSVGEDSRNAGERFTFTKQPGSEWDRVPEPYRAPATGFVEKLKRRGDYLGSLIFGSVVEKQPREGSDIDFVGFLTGPAWMLGQTRHAGRLFECWLHRLDKICLAILAYRHYFTLRNVAAGVLVDWQTDLLPKLKRVAEVNWPAGPLRPPASSHFYMRAKYQNLRDERRTRAKDEATSAFLQAWTLDNVITDFYRFYGLYVPKWNYLMKYLQVRDGIMHKLVVDYFDSRSLDEREPRLRRVVEHHLAPVGGYLPREWVVASGMETVKEKDERSGEWREWKIPDMDRIQPLKDAYGIGLNQWVRDGQSFPDLPPEYNRECRPIFWWDNPANPPLPFVDEAVKKLVKHYARKPHIMGILVFGSHGLDWAKPDSDVDLYLVTERRGKILEKRIVDGVEFGLEFVNFTDVYRGILTRRNTSYWRNFKESKILFTRHPSVPLMRELATILFNVGLPPLPPETVILFRKRLFHLLQDGDGLLAQGDLPGLLYNDNFTFCEAIRKWFRLHNWLDTKRTYIMRELKEKDEFLYRIVTAYLLSWDPAEKHEHLTKLIRYVLEPFGGPLPEEWAIPLVPHEVRDEDLDEFLRGEGVELPNWSKVTD